VRQRDEVVGVEQVVDRKVEHCDALVCAERRERLGQRLDEEVEEDG
jgi:hypothetical protein